VNSDPSKETPGRPTVVVVDDEAGDRDVMEAILADDYHVVLCSSGDEAIRILDQYPTAIVLCDQRMPGLTGDEVVSRVRILYPSTVRILVTAYTDVGALARALNEGGLFGYLEKPFEPDALRQMVAKAWKYQEIALENARILAEIRRLKAQVDDLAHPGNLPRSDSEAVLGTAARANEIQPPVSLKTRLHEEQERILRYGSPLSILIVDVDNCTEVRKTLGDAVAERVVRQVAGVLRRWSRTVDFVARHPADVPDRFAVLSPNTQEPGALILAERLRRTVAEMLMEPEDGRLLKVTASIGVAACEGAQGPPLTEVLRRAEESLGWAKRHGKNRVVTWSELKEALASRPQSRFVSRPQNAGPADDGTSARKGGV